MARRPVSTKVTEEMKERIVAIIDNGKMNMKAICLYLKDGKLTIYKFLYKNNISKIGKELAITGMYTNKTFKVNHHGIDYVVGNNANGKTITEGKSSNEDVITALTVIANMIKANGLDQRGVVVDLVYGESADKYFNKMNSEKLKMQFVGVGHKITVDDIEYEFDIDKISVMPEGIGVIFEVLAETVEIDEDDNLFFVTDIGGTTMNFIKSQGFLPIKGQSFSTEEGVNFLLPKLFSYIKQNITKDEEKMADETIVKALTGKKRKSLGETVDKLIKKFVEENICKYIEKQWELNHVNIKNTLKYQDFYFTGGGSQMFKEEIQEYFKVGDKTVTIRDNSVWSNANGFSYFAQSVLLDGEIKEIEEKVFGETDDKANEEDSIV